jgi:hypothetical protein
MYRICVAFLVGKPRQKTDAGAGGSVGDGTIGREELLGVSRRLKPLQALLPLAREVMVLESRLL